MAEKVLITWYGTASVRISAGSSQLLVDPFFPFYDSEVKVPENAFDNCRDILVSHGHFDHISSISDIVRADTTVYCTDAPYKSLCRDGINKTNLHPVKAGSVFSVGDFIITVYKGKHIKLSIQSCIKLLFSKNFRQKRRGIIPKLKKIIPFLERNETLCYLIDYKGTKIFVLGSLSLEKNTEYPECADLALFPYQGSDELFRIASEIYGVLKPKAVLLTHFDDTFPPFSSEIDTSEIEDFLKKHADVYKLKHGQSIEIQ